MENIHQFIENRRAFESLTDSEKTLVLSQMSQLEYEQQVTLMARIKQIKSQAVIDVPNRKAELQVYLQPKSSAQLYWISAAAACLIGVVLFHFLAKNKPSETLVVKEIKSSEVAHNQDVVVNNQNSNTPNLIPKKDVETKKNVLKIKKKKPLINPQKVDINELTEEDLAATFHRQNPNLKWQDDDDNFGIEKNKKTENRFWENE